MNSDDATPGAASAAAGDDKEGFDMTAATTALTVREAVETSPIGVAAHPETPACDTYAEVRRRADGLFCVCLERGIGYVQDDMFPTLGEVADSLTREMPACALDSSGAFPPA